MTSREKAERHLKSLGSLLQVSDDELSLPATDMEQFLGDVGGKLEKPTDDSSETADDDDEEEKEGQESEEEEEEGDDLEDEEQESQDDEDAEDESEESEEEGSESSEETGEKDETGDKEVKAKDKQNQCHALVPVTEEAVVATGELRRAAIRNSTTHKNEWDSYVRQLKSNGKIPCRQSQCVCSYIPKQSGTLWNVVG